jgi:hypothetical protein
MSTDSTFQITNYDKCCSFISFHPVFPLQSKKEEGTLVVKCRSEHISSRLCSPANGLRLSWICWLIKTGEHYSNAATNKACLGIYSNSITTTSIAHKTLKPGHCDQVYYPWI